MAKLINSSTDELEIKFRSSIRGVIDQVLMIFGFIAGVLSAWVAQTNDYAVWFGLLAFFIVGFIYAGRAFVVYRIAAARERAWRDPQFEEDQDA